MGNDIWVGIDPGSFKSGVCIFDNDKKVIIDAFHETNLKIPNRVKKVLENFEHFDLNVTFEKMRQYSVGAGESVFSTCKWQGRFIQWFQEHYVVDCYSVSSPDVKLTLLGTTRGVSKSAVRQALLEYFEPLGGGKSPQIGTKTKPGPLYNMRNASGYHHWDAFATIIIIQKLMKHPYEESLYVKEEPLSISL